ncbi:MAG: hypothetical protein ABSD74_04710 [Rhizomicrobium sp.]
MNRIPVGRTIAQAYGFAFGSYLSILGTIWLPSLLLVASGVTVFVPVIQQIATIAAHPDNQDFAPDQDIFRFLAVWQLAIYVIVTVVSVGVTRLAFNPTGRPRLIYFWFGLDELRAIGGMLLAFGLLYAYMIGVGGIVLIVVLAFAVGISGSENMDIPSHLNVLWTSVPIVSTILLFFAGIIYLQIRLNFMLVPITVGEHRFGVFRNWELTSGNVWRIVVVELATIVAPIIVFYIAILASIVVTVIGVSGLHWFDHAAHLPPLAVIQRVVEAFVPAFLLALASAPLLAGLNLGSSAFAYRALVPEGSAVN